MEYKIRRARADRNGNTPNRSARHTARRLLVSGVGIFAVLTTASLALPLAQLSADAASATHGSSMPGSVPFLDTLHTVNNIASTVPKNGDVNPYGIVNVPYSTGKLVANDTLISNFNAKSNLQGTGTTIVQISPSGHRTVFSRLRTPLPGACPGGIGLTTALTILQGGYVVVGSLPVTDAGKGTPKAGCLIVLNSNGMPVETWSGTLINGPWDLAAVQIPGFAQLFVTNVLNGTVKAKGKVTDGGTVVRLDVVLPPGHAPELVQETVIATGFAESLNSSALVLGPTGDALGVFDTLFVADTINNRVAAIPFASFRFSAVPDGGYTVSQGGGLNAPLGMTIAPNGDILTANGNDANAVETTPWGQQVAVVQMDPLGSGGDLFGLTLTPDHSGILFVDDGDNTLKSFVP
jgi:hypothetical protein